MVERGRGQLVFVASFAGKVPSAGESSIYTATKFGLRGFAHVLRAQMKRKDVGVSLVTPGPVRDAGMFARGGAQAAAARSARPPRRTSARPSCARSSATPPRSTSPRSGLRAMSKARRARARDDRRPAARRLKHDRRQGARADVFEHGAGEVLRRYREPRDTEREVAAMEHARAHGYPVPAARALNDTDIVMERVEGPTMLEDIDAQAVAHAVATPPRWRGSTSSCTRSRRRRGCPRRSARATRCCTSTCIPTT